MMKIIKKNEGDVRSSNSIGGDNKLTHILPAQKEGGISLTLVQFEDGARTHWHEHPGEQVLFILEGSGRVGTENQEWVVEPGDVVYTSPGERHWHGALPGEAMTHISITNVGPPTWYDQVK
jgi:quercetin dioxygenase-like cupin family protein